MTLPRASPRHGGRTRDLTASRAAAREQLSLAIAAGEGITRRPIMLPVAEVEHDTSDIATLWFEVDIEVAAALEPGMFWMLWNPYDEHGGLDRPGHHSEKPYSVGVIESDHTGHLPGLGHGTGVPGMARLGFTVKDLGRQSGTLTRLEAGDLVALKGPFGTTFSDPGRGERLILLSGGIGSTPLHLAACAARQHLGEAVEIVAIMGFQNAAGAHYVERMQAVCDEVLIATDDGSLGHHGFPTALLPEVLERPGPARLFTCGPEPMMAGALALCRDHGVPAEASMERYLPCGVAVCGLCMVGDRLTCQEGPVLPGEWLLEQTDFGAPHAS